MRTATAALALALTTPALHLAAASPTVVVRGSGFHARERVTLVAGVKTLHLRTTRLGTFRLDTGVRLSRCNSLIVTATGARGDRALLTLPRPACMPARSP